MKKIVFLCLPLIAMIICGCPDENAPQPTPKQSEIVPLALGNKWTYKKEYSYTDDEGIIVSKVETRTISLDSVRDIEGKKVFTEIGSTVGGIAQVWGYVFNDKDGHWITQKSSSYTSLIAKYPGNVGYKWNEDTVTVTNEVGKKLGQFFIYTYIVSTNTSVKANNKGYNCYQYRSQLCDLVTKEPIANSFRDTYYAENIGLVMVKQIHDGYQVSQTELIDYTLK